jgi:hypothetical protein
VRLADYEYQTPTIVGTQIRLQKQSDTNILKFKLDSDLSGGAITISLDGGSTSKPLKDIDGNAVTELSKGFVEVVEDAVNFTLAPKGAKLDNIITAIENKGGTVSEPKKETQIISAINGVNSWTGIYGVNETIFGRNMTTLQAKKASTPFWGSGISSISTVNDNIVETDGSYCYTSAYYNSTYSLVKINAKVVYGNIDLTSLGVVGVSDIKNLYYRGTNNELVMSMTGNSVGGIKVINTNNMSILRGYSYPTSNSFTSFIMENKNSEELYFIDNTTTNLYKFNVVTGTWTTLIENLQTIITGSLSLNKFGIVVNLSGVPQLFLTLCSHNNLRLIRINLVIIEKVFETQIASNYIDMGYCQPYPAYNPMDNLVYVPWRYNNDDDDPQPAIRGCNAGTGASTTSIYYTTPSGGNMLFVRYNDQIKSIVVGTEGNIFSGGASVNQGVHVGIPVSGDTSTIGSLPGSYWIAFIDNAYVAVGYGGYIYSYYLDNKFRIDS